MPHNASDIMKKTGQLLISRLHPFPTWRCQSDPRILRIQTKRPPLFRAAAVVLNAFGITDKIADYWYSDFTLPQVAFSVGSVAQSHVALPLTVDTRPEIGTACGTQSTETS